MGVTPLSARARPSIVDGLFYPAERERLASTVDELLARSPTPEGACFAVVSPHAAYDYAGETMASAFKAVALRSVRTAVLIGPMHRDPVDAILLPESETFSTPLGDIPVDQAAVESLLAADAIFRRDDIPHLEEHSLEVQVPFLLRMFPETSIVPVLVGGRGMAPVTALSRALRLTFPHPTEYTLFVVSANMATSMSAKDTDEESDALERLIADRDWRGIVSASEARTISSCGAAGIAAILRNAGRDCGVEILARSSSRGRGEDRDRVVRYAAIGMHDGVHADGAG